MSVEKQFIEARTKADVPDSVVLYCARHTFATDVLAATGNLALIMKTMGHSDAKTAMVYQHPAIEAVRKAVDARNLSRLERHNSRHSPVRVQ